MPSLHILAPSPAAAQGASRGAAPEPGPSEPSPAGDRLPFQAYLHHGSAAGVTWTLLRKRVLRAIWSAAGPIGAYGIAERLKETGHKVSPVSVYRCLHAFDAAGLVVPIVSLKRYLPSPDPAGGPWGFLLCRSCGSWEPVDLGRAHARLGPRLAADRFLPRRYALECPGLCRACAAPGEAA